jgi:hypothetical protein
MRSLGWAAGASALLAALVGFAPRPGCGPTALRATRLAAVAGFATPETALWDARRGHWIVSNVNGGGAAKDGNGFLSLLAANGGVTNRRWVAGGAAGAVLNAPKGMLIRRDTLWVADIDVVRAFDAATGRALRGIAVPGAVFLNDLAAGPDGAIYVTDTGITFDAAGGVHHPGPDRVWRIGPNGRVSVVAQGDALAWPNGIEYDSAGRRFLLAPLHGHVVQDWRPGREPRAVATGPGGYDGVEALSGGRVLVSSQDGGSVLLVDHGRMITIVSDLASPANIGYDARDRRVAVPLLDAGRVEIWQLPASAAEVAP